MGQISLEDRIGNAVRAFYTQHPDTFDTIYWTVETFANHIIVDENRLFYRVDYTINGDEFEFAPRDQWQQVSTEWTVISNTTDIKSTDTTPAASQKGSSSCIKMLGQNRIGGYAVIWGSANERDLDGEWFDRDTEEMPDIFKSVGKLPYLYNHAMDGVLKTSVIGVVDIIDEDDVGLWYEVQLENANLYAEAFTNLVNDNKLGTSSGTLSGAVQIEKSGRIARWPIVELSATPTPADPRQRSQHPVHEVKSIFKSIGLDFTYIGNPDKKAKATEPEAG